MLYIHIRDMYMFDLYAVNVLVLKSMLPVQGMQGMEKVNLNRPFGEI